MLYEILQNMDGFYVSSCLSGQRSRETYRTADLTKSKTFGKTYKQTFEELQEKLNPWSVVGLRHCKTVTRKTRSEDKTFLRMRPPLKMDIQQPSMGLSTPYRAKNRCYKSPCYFIISLLYMYQM